MKTASIVTSLALLAGMSLSGPLAADDALRAAIDDPARDDARTRDAQRHPYETLTFFGIEPGMTVVELSPGGGWYSQILGPYLTATNGKLIAAHVDLESETTPAFYHDIHAAFMERIADSERFAAVDVIAWDPPRKPELGEPGSADLVLSFRSMHGWKRSEVVADVLASAHAVLKRGGVLGIVQHRLPEDGDDSQYTGYVKQSWVVAMAESNGFRLVEASEINANPNDTADHPEGVWNLPPSLRNVPDDEQDAWRAIGESDRMTLKFVKR
ncbi:MAG: methyltransferase [Wenzhouxiangellaceae bacterium]|nr:methyltransferase [Wenzhouxiangellaceae bacterium]